MGIEILFRRETADDYKVAADAAHFDGVDTVRDPVTGMLGLVAVQDGRRICQQCGGHFNQSDRKLRMTPVYTYPDAPPMFLHAKCEVPPMKIFQLFKGLQKRREVANIVKKSLGLDKASGTPPNGGIIGG
jgi:hypothetical protein